MLPDSLFFLAKGGRVILSRNREISGAHAIGTQCDLRAIASKFGRHSSPRRAPTRGGGLPIVFSRRLALGRAPTRGAPTDCLLSAFGPGKGTHKGCPYRFSRRLALGRAPQGVPLAVVFSRRLALGRAPTRGAPTDCLVSLAWEGPHKGCPYRMSCLGVWPGITVLSRRLALGRAPTRGAPTECLVLAFWPGKGTHKGCPYRMSCLGVLAWEDKGLAVVFSRRLALGRAPTRGAPTGCLLSFWPWEGHPQGVPLPDCLVLAFGPGKGTHKGCPYRLSCLGVWPGKGTHKGCPYRLSQGHPQGVPLPIVFSRLAGRAPTRGAPTDCLLPGKGTHKGCPYRMSSLGVLAWEGRPQGVPLPNVFSRRLALGRAPTRGAPTDCLLLAFWPGKGTHKGCPYRMSSLGVLAWEGHPQGVPLAVVFSRRFALGRAPTRGAPTRFRQPYVVFSNLMQLP